MNRGNTWWDSSTLVAAYRDKTNVTDLKPSRPLLAGGVHRWLVAQLGTCNSRSASLHPDDQNAILNQYTKARIGVVKRC